MAQSESADYRNRTKVWFELEEAEDGWPPADGENLWAEPLGQNLYTLDNVPFFVYGVGVGDVVRAEPDQNGELKVSEIVESYGNVAIRLVPFPDIPVPLERHHIIEMFAGLNVTGEGIEGFNLVALDIPPGTDYAAVKSLIRRGSDQGWWDCDEGCINDAWAETEPDVRAE